MTPEANTSSGGTGSWHRPAPHDPDAEAQVIGAALSTASRYPRPNLIPSDFWVPAHRQLWELISTTTGPYKPCDLPESLRDAGRAAVSAWTGIDPAVPAKMVFRSTIARNIIRTAGELIDLAYEVDLEGIENRMAAMSANLEGK
jgi:replicative DNA helicase